MKFSIAYLPATRKNWVQIQFALTGRFRKVGPEFETYDEANAYCQSIKPRK